MHCMMRITFQIGGKILGIIISRFSQLHRSDVSSAESIFLAPSPVPSAVDSPDIRIRGLKPQLC